MLSDVNEVSIIVLAIDEIILIVETANIVELVVEFKPI
jgi:hypothetical protein